MSAIITAMTTCFSAVFSWITDAIQSVIPVFYTAPTSSGGTGELTFLGVLTLVSLAISIFFLIMGLIQNFLHLRG